MSQIPLLEPSECPFEFFALWMEEASSCGLIEPYAMTLATVGSDGRPSARHVLLKDHGESGFVFYTNYNSRKAVELSQNSYASAVLWWDRLYRQVRIEGHVEIVSGNTSDEYFSTRPLGSQISAWASPQSDVIDSFEELKASASALEVRFEGQSIPRPEFWGGYRLVPDCIEFWQGRVDRLHERVRYRADQDKWITERLGP